MKDNLKKFYFSNAAASRLVSGTSAALLKDIDEFLLWELDNRVESRNQRLLKSATFPTMKSLEDYRFDEPAMPTSMSMEEMTSLDFIRHRNTLVLYGICGSVKTMLSIALGAKACMNGF